MFNDTLPAAVRETLDLLEREFVPRDDALALPRAAGELLHLLILASGARVGVEVGTSYGYSGLFLASALAANGGRLITIDKSAKKVMQAREHFARAGLADVVEVVQSEAAAALAKIAGPIDFALLDADKQPALDYFNALAPKLRPGGVIATDNINTHAEQLAPYIADLRTRAGFRSAAVEIGNGVELTVRLPG